MNKAYIAVILAATVFLSVIIIPADSYIPPTRAFMRIFSGGENLTATSYNANLTFTAGTNMVIDLYPSNNTIRFGSGGASSLAMEGLSNVTSTGCAVGQARTVNASGWYVCSNVGTGDVTGAANVGTGTGTVFRDESSGTLNLKTLKEGANISITNNADDITITAAAGASGYTQINNLDGGDAALLAGNSSNHATVKTLTAGTGITITNGSKTITISSSASGGFTKINNVGPTRDISPVATNSSGVANIRGIDCGDGLTCVNGTGTNANTMSTNFKVNTKAAATRQFLVSYNNATTSGNFGTTTFGVNTQTCSASQFVSAINNSTGAVTCSSVSGLPVSLSGNLTTTSSAAFTTIFTIPLTANSGNIVQGTLIADTGTAGVAVQTGARLSAMTQTGWCLWETPTTATANTVDFLVLSTTTAETGETVWLPAVNTPQPIRFTCATKGSGTPNLLVEFQAETGVNTVNIRGGSFYLKSP